MHFSSFSIRKFIKPNRAALYKFISATFGLFLAVFIFEVLLRIFWNQYDLPIPLGSLTNDPATGITWVPGFDGDFRTVYHKTHITINSFGMRDVPRLEKPPTGTFRILAVGDSYVAGHGVEEKEIFLSVAEKLLIPPPGYQKAEIMKMGVGGWGPRNEVNFLLKNGAKYSPQLVIMNFFLGNDYYDADHSDQYIIYAGMRIQRNRLNEGTYLLRLKIFLRSHIEIYNMAYLIYNSMANSSNCNDEDLQMINWCTNEARKPSLALNGIIDQLQGWSAKSSIPIVVLILPQRMQFDLVRRQQISSISNINIGHFNPNAPEYEIDAILDRHGILKWNALPPLLAAENSSSLTFAGDTHYNSAGHKAIGQWLAGQLNQYLRQIAEKSHSK
jgi:hypothetical protein